MAARKFTARQEREICRQYEAGASSLLLAGEWNTTHHTIKAAVRRAGGTIRKPGGPRRVGNRVRMKSGILVTLPLDDPLAAMSPRTGRGRVLEHRLLLARMLGRALRPDEQVHHINGDRFDNRIENLELRHGNHGSGIRLVCLDCGSHNVVPEELGETNGTPV